jgi:hypothetical protein
MQNNIKIDIKLDKVCNALDGAIENALEEAIGELESQTKKNTKVKTGKTKASWQHKVDSKKSEAYVGSNYDNAIWEEFGTGIYAQHGNGRKDVPWVYRDEQGKWHRTSGKKPRKALQRAFNSTKNSIESYFKEKFKDL